MQFVAMQGKQILARAFEIQKDNWVTVAVIFSLETKSTC